MAVIYSTWCRTEFASALGVKHRGGSLKAEDLARAERGFQAWLRRAGPALAVTDDDVGAAERLCLRRELKLRAPDALHLAIVLRLGFGLITFDENLADAARLCRVEVFA